MKSSVLAPGIPITMQLSTGTRNGTDIKSSLIKLQVYRPYKAEY